MTSPDATRPCCTRRESDHVRGAGSRSGRTSFWSIPALATLLALLPGCWSFQEGSQGLPREAPAAAMQPSDWPPRDLAPVQELLASTPDEIHWYTLAKGADPEKLTESERSLLKTMGTRITYKGIHGKGLLRVVESLREPDPKGDDDGAPGFAALIDFLTSGFSPNAYWLTSKTLEGIREFDERSALFASPTDDAPGILPPPTPEDTTKANIEQAVPQTELHLQQGMYIRFPARAGKDKPYRGVVVHLNAMFGNEYEVKTLDEFRERGWAVIDLKPTSQIAPPVPPQWAELGRKSIQERRELIARICTEIGGSPRITATSTDHFSRLVAKYRAHPLASEVDRLAAIISRCQAGAFLVSGPQDYDSVSAVIAQQLDQAQAGSAYAAEAVLDYVKSQRPDLQGIPMVLIGFSAGGLATPTTAARIMDQISAVVIIGGGADCFSASQLSKFSDGGLHVRTTLDDPVGDHKLPKEQVAPMSEFYLKYSKLDPYHTAPLLAGKPVLLVTGKTDTWVPAACGQLLWERMGRPDRLQIDAGHELLFYFLPNKAGFIADWVEKTVLAKPESLSAR